MGIIHLLARYAIRSVSEELEWMQVVLAAHQCQPSTLISHSLVPALVRSSVLIEAGMVFFKPLFSSYMHSAVACQ